MQPFNGLTPVTVVDEVVPFRIRLPRGHPWWKVPQSMQRPPAFPDSSIEVLVDLLPILNANSTGAVQSAVGGQETSRVSHCRLPSLPARGLLPAIASSRKRNTRLKSCGMTLVNRWRLWASPSVIEYPQPTPSPRRAAESTIAVHLVLGAERIEIHHFRIHPAHVQVEYVADPAGHPGPDVAAHRSEDHRDTAGHVLQSVITDPFDDSVNARVPHAEPFAHLSADEDLTTRRSVRDHVAGDDVVLGNKGGAPVGPNDESASRQPLTEVSFVALESRVTPAGTKAPKD